MQRSTTGSFRAPTKAEIARGSADPRDLAVRDVMSRSVLSVSEDQTLSDVATLMNSKDVDRFPVTREGAVVGFLTRADLVRKLVSF
jgi:CBS domain-containing protein